MSRITQHIEALTSQVLSNLVPKGTEIPSPLITPTRKEFDGDFTLVVFPYTRIFRKKPEEIAALIGDALMETSDSFKSYGIVKGFLNLSLKDHLWTEYLQNIDAARLLERAPQKGKRVMVEFSSPNTNKPIHLGHVRNILLGWSSAQLLDAAGYDVIKTQIINDRGIAICKSMLAWKLYGNGDTPSSTDIKPDHFVGNYYVKFESEFQAEYSTWKASSEGKDTFQAGKKEDEDEAAFFKRFKNEYFNKHSQLGGQAREMLQQWEAGDEEVRGIWRQMNGWVYQGFDKTFNTLGVSFDKNYYESETYLQGKKIVEEGMAKGIFTKAEDGSVWADLTSAGMDKKIVLRSDGTAVYITQDLGTAQLRYDEFKMDRAVYVVADEQDYHFQVLFELLRQLGRPYADDLHHLNYGMVDLPTGKMKSREGTVVDADDLMQDVIAEAKAGALERGELEGLSDLDKDEMYRKIGMGALKFFILKVNPKKRMTFDPKESVDMQGQTGPYIQNAYVRILSVLRKFGNQSLTWVPGYDYPSTLEKEVIQELYAFTDVINDAAENLDPSSVANYLYNLAKLYHRFYHEHRILTAESGAAISFRLHLSNVVSQVLKRGMNLLGIEMPTKM